MLGHTFNYGGEKDGEEALKMLANDPHTAKFISTDSRATLFPIIRRQHSWIAWRKITKAPTAKSATCCKTMIYSPEFWSQRSLSRQSEDSRSNL